MEKSYMGWREAFWLKNKGDFIPWVLIGLVYLIMLIVDRDSSGAYFLKFYPHLKGILIFLGILAFIFILRKLHYFYFCGKCLKNVNSSDKYCRYCGEKFGVHQN